MSSHFATLAEKLGAVLVRRNTDLRVVQVAPIYGDWYISSTPVLHRIV